MASLMWRPCVKFDTTHYVYVKDANGLPRLLQRNVGAADETPSSHFCQPAAGQARPPLPATRQTPSADSSGPPPLAEMMRRSRSVFDPEMHPLCADFEDAGMQGAFATGCSVALRKRANAAEVPQWVRSLDFAAGRARACARSGNALAAGAQPSRPPGAPVRGDEENAKPSPRRRRAAPATQAAAAVRLSFGEMLEAFARSVALSVVDVENVPAPSVDSGRAHRALLRLVLRGRVDLGARRVPGDRARPARQTASPTEQLVRDFMVPAPRALQRDQR